MRVDNWTQEGGIFLQREGAPILSLWAPLWRGRGQDVHPYLDSIQSERALCLRCPYQRVQKARCADSLCWRLLIGPATKGPRTELRASIRASIPDNRAASPEWTLWKQDWSGSRSNSDTCLKTDYSLALFCLVYILENSASVWVLCSVSAVVYVLTLCVCWL